jgi:hypothetical protein
MLLSISKVVTSTPSFLENQFLKSMETRESTPRLCSGIPLFAPAPSSSALNVPGSTRFKRIFSASVTNTLSCSLSLVVRKLWVRSTPRDRSVLVSALTTALLCVIRCKARNIGRFIHSAIGSPRARNKAGIPRPVINWDRPRIASGWQASFDPAYRFREIASPQIPWLQG